MSLIKINKKTNTTETRIELEQVATDLIMISIDNNISDHSGVFNYWRRLGSGVNPPLEIGINTNTGVLKRICFFVDSDCFKKFQLASISASEGNILVDTSIFTKKFDFIDTKGNYFVNLIDKKFICMFTEGCDAKESIVNGNIEFYFDDDKQLTGFGISNLTDSNINTIKSLLKDATVALNKNGEIVTTWSNGSGGIR